MFQRTVQLRDQIQPTQIPRSQTTGGLKPQNQGHSQLLLFRGERLKNWTPKPASNMAESVAHCYKKGRCARHFKELSAEKNIKNTLECWKIMHICWTRWRNISCFQVPWRVSFGGSTICHSRLLHRCCCGFCLNKIEHDTGKSTIAKLSEYTKHINLHILCAHLQY